MWTTNTLDPIPTPGSVTGINKVITMLTILGYESVALIISLTLTVLFGLSAMYYVHRHRKALASQMQDICNVAYASYHSLERCEDCLTPANLVSRTVTGWRPFIQGSVYRAAIGRMKFRRKEKYHDKYIHCATCDCFVRELEDGTDAAGLLSKNWASLAQLEFARLLSTLEDIKVFKAKEEEE